MEVQNPETHARKIKSERFGKIAVGFFFLLALLWSLGAFIIWILLWTSVYFSFLFFYYRPRQPKVSFSSRNFSQGKPSSFSSDDPEIAKKGKAILQVVIVFTALFFVFFFVVSILSKGDSTEEDTAITSNAGDNENAEILKGDLDNVNALTERGNQFFSQEQYDSALIYYNKVLAMEPDNSASLYNKGLVYYNQKRYQESIDALKNCLRVDDANRDAMYIMGHNYYDRQLYDDALDWYKRAYDAGLRDAFLSHALGYLYDNKGNSTQSLFHYKEALQQDSTRTEIYSRLAELEPEKAFWYKRKEEQWKQEKNE
jgi:tetratricopeptide (TPR) repeat protein